jgi:manganese oxidase
MKFLLFLPLFLFGNINYHPVITPNVGSLPFEMEGDVRVFHLVAEQIRREFAPGFWVNCWGYNGSSPGPTIEAVEGERVRIYVTNCLNEATSVHWHGLIIPNGMDGVLGLNQRGIQPGETFKYEFTLKQNGTYMYHPHSDDVVQVALGMMGFFIIHPKEREEPPVDRDFAIFLHEWNILQGTATPNPMSMDFNLFTFNSVVYPTAEPLLTRRGDHVRIRFANIMMNSHPIHLHGHEFTVTRCGAQRLPLTAQYTANTINVAPGETRDIELIASNPGDWAMHCHKPHHVMNQMDHSVPNLVGIPSKNIEERMRKIFPNFIGLMYTNGMGHMFEMYGTHKIHPMGMKKITFPKNLAPIGNPGPYGVIEMGGMFTIFKVRDEITKGSEMSWYHQPSGTSARAVSIDEVPQSIRHLPPNPIPKTFVGRESWLSQEEVKRHQEDNEKQDWMESKQ